MVRAREGFSPPPFSTLSRKRSGYAPEGNGVFGVGPVEACNLEISNICLNPSTPTDEIIVEPGVGEANDGNLEFLIYASINRGGYVSRISFGDTGACNYPGPRTAANG